MGYISEMMARIDGMLERADDRLRREQVEAVKFRRDLALWRAEQAKNKKPTAPKVVRARPVTPAEREMIARLRAKGQTYEVIAKAMGRTEASCRIIMYGLRAEQKRQAAAK